MLKLNLLVLRCKDMERSREFYELLGMRFAKHSHGGPEHYASEDERGVFELYPLKKDQREAAQTGLGFCCGELEALRTRFEVAGFEPSEIKTQPWGTSFVIRDPDGRRVEIVKEELLPSS